MPIKDAVNSFNTYGVLWRKDSIEFFVNSKSTGKIIKKEEYASDWPFDKYFYLLLNCTVGGDWAGRIDDKSFPYEYIIDYVKIWQDS